MKNSMLDVHNMLVARMEELSEENLAPEKLDNVVKRADASVKVAGAIVANSRLVLDAQKLAAEHGASFDQNTVPMLTAKKVN